MATTPPSDGTGIAPFCTTLPPPRPTLSPDLRFRCDTVAEMTDTELTEWRELVGTRWEIAALRHRLEGAWIAQLWIPGVPVATCVLRRGPAPAMWILETLVARPVGCGYATALTRSAMTWIYERVGPFVLAYTWELSIAQYAVAWWRGWLKSAVTALEYGWIWTPPGECSFCSKTATTIYPVGSSQLRTVENGVAQIIVSDSGLGDGLGYVLNIENDGNAVDWAIVARAGNWRALWYHGRRRPVGYGWAWTGEIVVVGLLNYDGRSNRIPTRWITTEIASKSL
jgi:hypothetical protein